MRNFTNILLMSIMLVIVIPLWLYVITRLISSAWWRSWKEETTSKKEEKNESA
jgi:ACR3 family arsenite efflux pump ArsB